VDTLTNKLQKRNKDMKTNNEKNESASTDQKTNLERSTLLLSKEQLEQIREKTTVDFNYPKSPAPGDLYTITDKGKAIGMINNYDDAELIVAALSAARRGFDDVTTTNVISNLSSVLAHNWEINLHMNIILYQMLANGSSDEEIKKRFHDAFDKVATKALKSVATGGFFRDVPFEDTQRVI